MKLPKKTGENINFMFSQTSSIMRVYVDKEMEDLGLTRSQWILLSILHSINGCSQQELATVMGIGKGALGKLVRKLADKGWIKRDPNSNDGRVINLYITEQAQPMVEKLVELLFEDSRRSLTGISRKDIDMMRSLMHRIRNNIDNKPHSKKWSQLKRELTEEVKRLNS